MPSLRCLLPLLPFLVVRPAAGQADLLEKARQDLLAAERSFGADDPRTAQARLVLGIRQARAGQPREAKATITRALEVFVAAKNANGEASARIQLAVALEQLGDRVAALEQAELGLELRRQHVPEGPKGDIALAEA